MTFTGGPRTPKGACAAIHDPLSMGNTPEGGQKKGEEKDHTQRRQQNRHHKRNNRKPPIMIPPFRPHLMDLRTHYRDAMHVQPLGINFSRGNHLRHHHHREENALHFSDEKGRCRFFFVKTVGMQGGWL